MRSVGDGVGIDLMTDTHPPKSLYIEVRCVQVKMAFKIRQMAMVLGIHVVQVIGQSYVFLIP